VTLFHALPGEHLGAVRQDLSEEAARLAPQPVAVDRVRSLGRGVAYDLRCPEVTAARGRLQRAWEPWLTRQDAQGGGLHVTVANKMEPGAARALLADLAASPLPPDATGTGFGLWRYDGGPWEPVEVLPFTGSGDRAHR
jgi:hypothetical protein